MHRFRALHFHGVLPYESAALKGEKVEADDDSGDDENGEQCKIAHGDILLCYEPIRPFFFMWFSMTSPSFISGFSFRHLPRVWAACS